MLIVESDVKLGTAFRQNRRIFMKWIKYCSLYQEIRFEDFTIDTHRNIKSLKSLQKWRGYRGKGVTKTNNDNEKKGLQIWTLRKIQTTLEE